jgi:hypothetical protein
MTEFDEYWRKAGAGAAKNPSAWLSSADSLHRAAQLLWTQSLEDLEALRHRLGNIQSSLEVAELLPPPNTVAPGLMLSGLAIENLLKGLAVARDADLRSRIAVTKHLLPPELTSHLSVKLASLALVELSPAERTLLERLATFIDWGGRYPVPKRPEKLAYIQGESEPPTRWSSEDFPLVDQLFHKLRDELVHEARERDMAEEATERANRLAQRPIELEKLEGLEKVTEGEITLFVDTDVEAEPGTAISCVACGNNFVLDWRTRAAICGCSTLHVAVRRFEAPQKRHVIFAESFPAQ